MNPTGFASPNERDVAILKRNSEVLERKQTTLYFVGIEQVKELDGRSPIIFVKGQPFTLPLLGESVTVDEVIAKDLIAKTRWSPERGKDAVAHDVLIREEQGGQQMAQMIKEAIENGVPLEELNLYKAQKKHIANAMSDDELLTLLEERGLATDAKGGKPGKGKTVNKSVPTDE